MTTRYNIIALYGLAFCFCLILPSTSRAVSLQVENTTAHLGDSITVRISVDQPADIAAAVFALSYAYRRTKFPMYFNTKSC